MDNALFVVEGKITEEKILNCIYNTYYADESQRSPNGKRHELRENALNIEIIKDANIPKFVDEIECEYSEGVGIDTYFGDGDTNYSMCFVIVDADLKDKDGGIHDSCKRKVELLNKLNVFIEGIDNSYLIINSPQVECLVDNNDIYKYKHGEEYKKIINNQCGGLVQEFGKDVTKYLIGNIQKFQADNVELNKQAIHAINEYNYETSEIKVRSNLHQIILNLELCSEEELIDFLTEKDNYLV